MALQQIFIQNLKKFRKEQGLSQMALSERCGTTSNYIGQIEMGRRVPSFEKIEEIAAALGVDSFRFFMGENAAENRETALDARGFLKKLPGAAKKEIISRLMAAIMGNITASLDPENYPLTK
jgi:transcriptional regulator with XRE-family HTH domain